MEKLDTTLERWRQIEPQWIKAGRIKRDPALQPRAPELIQGRHRPRQEAASAEHVDRMHAQLETFADAEMEPLLVARFDSGLFLVDGHHRLTAYQRARRPSVPVRILDTDRRTAVALSKLVNLDGVKLPMEKEQARDALWQYLAHVTGRGVRPAGESLRALAARFGVSPQTVKNMRDRLPSVRMDDYPEPALDPGTGWPRWKHAKGCGGWKDADALLGLDALRRRKAEKAAARLWKLRDQCGTEAFLDGLRLAASQASERDDDDDTAGAFLALADADDPAAEAADF